MTTRLEIEIDSSNIIVINQDGKSKTFPRCGITNVEFFVREMVNSGNLNDLLLDD